MKLKLVKANEIVISREEYEELIDRRLPKVCAKDYQEFNRAILNCSAKYECRETQGCYYVFINGENCIYPIKKFASDDPDYNRICAEELVELLNAKQ